MNTDNLRNEKCKDLFGFGYVALCAVVAVVAAYEHTGRPVLRAEVERLIERNEGRTTGGNACTAMLRRGYLKIAGRVGCAVAYLPTDRGHRFVSALVERRKT